MGLLFFCLNMYYYSNVNMPVKKILTFFSMLLIVNTAYGNAFRVTPYISLYSTTLTGTDDALNADGKLVSNSNLLAGLKMSYSLSQAFNLVFDYSTGSIAYDNTQDVISDNDSYTKSKISLGTRWILHPRVVFKFLFNIDKEVGFTIVTTDNNKAMLDAEPINYFSINYDQIVFMGGGTYSGFFIGYSPNSSSDTYFARTSTEYGLFFVLQGFRASYKIENKTKESDDLKFTEDDSALELSYTFRF